MDDEATQLTIQCPQCGDKTAHDVEQLRAQPRLTCPACGAAFEVSRNYLDEAIRFREGFGD